MTFLHSFLREQLFSISQATVFKGSPPPPLMRRGQQGCCLFILPTRRLLDKHALVRSAFADAASETSPGLGVSNATGVCKTRP